MPVDRCVCRGVPFARLKALADAGARDLETLTARTGCGTGCGMCIPYIREMLRTGRTVLPVMPAPPRPGRPCRAG